MEAAAANATNLPSAGPPGAMVVSNPDGAPAGASGATGQPAAGGDGRDPKVWRAAAAAAHEGDGPEADEVPSPCPSPASEHSAFQLQPEAGHGACSACGSAFLSRETVRWHPLVTLPQCLECFARANAMLTRVLVQHYQRGAVEAGDSNGGGSSSNGTGTRKRARPMAAIDGLLCVWCLHVLPEDAQAVLRCGRPKHALCPSRPAAASGQPCRLVVCQSCVATHASPERAAQWREQHAHGAWACFICDKLPLLVLALEKGWGLPSYPQDLRMAAEVQEALHKLFSTPHRLLPASSPSPSPSPTPSDPHGHDGEGASKRPRHAPTAVSNGTIGSDADATPAPSPTLSAPSPPPGSDLQSLMDACGGDAGLIALVEQTQQALSLLTRLWREAAVRVAAREDLLDDVGSNGGGATREAMLLAEGSLLEGEGLRRRPTIDYLTASVAEQQQQRLAGDAGDAGEAGAGAAKGSRSGSSRAASPAAAGGPAGSPEAEAQRAVRSSLAELRVLLRQMRAMNDQQQEQDRERASASAAAAAAAAAVVGRLVGPWRAGKRPQQQQHQQRGDEEAKGGPLQREGEGGEEGTASLALDYEMGRMEQLHAWLLSSQGVLRSLHSQVQAVLQLAQEQQHQHQHQHQQQAQEEKEDKEKEARGAQPTADTQGPGEAGAGPRGASTEFQRRLQESGESLVQLEKDLSLRLEDVGFAVSLLCRLKGEAEERKEGAQQPQQKPKPQEEPQQEEERGEGSGGSGIEAID